MSKPVTQGGPARKAAATPPPDPGVLLQEAIRQHQSGALEMAADLYRRVLDQQPRNTDALHLLGLVLHQCGDPKAALPLIRQAIRLNGTVAAYHNSLGAVLLACDMTENAAAAFRQAIRLAPGYAEAHNNLGNAAQKLGWLAEAVECYQRAVAARPDYADPYSNLSVALRALGRLREAEAAARQALTLKPDYASAHANLGIILHDQSRYDEALTCYETALSADPGHAEAHVNRAVQLLQLGRLEEAWPDYEWRWQMQGFTTPKRPFAQPAWDGGNLNGRILLLHAEQGLGSAIQFVRYAPGVAANGGRLVLECQRPLARLFRHSLGAPRGPVASVIVKGETLPAFDVHLPLMSLPQRFATSLASIPADVPYLAADADAVAAWRERLKGRPRPRIGLAWAGNPNHLNDRNRSMPARAFIPLINRAAGSFFSLQVGPGASAQLKDLPATVVDLTFELADFLDTAALIQALDLVISVDTAVAHLAGALAKPVWLLLPFVPEWRWLLDRDDSPWYPTMRLFRQSAPGDWAGVIERLADALTAAISGP